MRYFIYGYTSHSGTSITAIFDTQPSLDEDDLISELKAYYHTNGVSQKIIYLYPTLSQVEGELVQIISSASNTPIGDIVLAGYNRRGIVALNDTISECLEFGTKQIIKSNGLVLQSDGTFHFINPSKKHSPFFIRTGNILTKSNEINFLAMLLLSHLDDDMTEIRCDTSSLLALSYGIYYLRTLFNQFTPIQFSTFSSYENFASIKRGALVLISASSSGGLEDQILETITDATIVTIIFNCPDVVRKKDGKHRKFLINVNAFFVDLLSPSHPVQQYFEDKCQYCDDYSIPVVVRSEQFIPSKVVIQNVLIKKNSVSSQMIRAISDLTCCNTIYTNKSEKLSEKTREIFFDFSAILIGADPSFSFLSQCERILKNQIPISVDVIIFLDDDFSKSLAEHIYTYIQKCQGRTISKPISSSRLNELDPASISTILIVAGCISRGSRLHTISTKLRRFHKTSLHYIIGVLRLEQEEDSLRFRSNLELRQDDVQVNKVHTIYDIFLPNHNSLNVRKHERSAWLEEEEFLRKAILKYPEYPGIISTRLELVRDRIAGLRDNLFYQNPFNNGPLVLRPNFALHNFKNKNPSQADVYFLMSMVFHVVRNPRLFRDRKNDNKFLIQHEHAKSLLDPENFSRYNDGILQACILRMARPSELDYSVDETSSLSMLSVLKSVLHSGDDESSEAILEFLYALASRKLRLKNRHVEDFVMHIENSFAENKQINYFSTIIKDNISNPQY